MLGKSWHHRGFALALGILSFGNVAWGYRTAGDLPEFEGTEKVRWPAGVASFVLVDDLPAGVGGVETNADLVRAALRAWTGVECTSFQAGLAGLTSTEAAYGDNQNSIQWVSFGWEDYGFEPGAAGASDVRYEEVDGQWVIVEADVYLNAQDHDWSTGAGTDDEREISGVLTHELGHALGLLHPCLESVMPLCTPDQNENPPTMHPAYSHGQVSLEPDDIDGICFLYPACTDDTCADGEECTINGCATVCEGVTCEVGEACVEGECFDYTDPCQVGSPECEDCASDEECGWGYSCQEGECILEAELPLGDPCEGATECASGVCGEAGYCTVFCSIDEQCGEEGVCDTEKNECESDSREPIGGACDSADDCLGEQCLADLTDEPVCTRECDPEGVACPFDWECSEVEENLVCAPPPPPLTAEGCGCRMVGRPSAASSRALPSGGAPLALFSAILATFYLRRRRGHACKLGLSSNG